MNNLVVNTTKTMEYASNDFVYMYSTNNVYNVHGEDCAGGGCTVKKGEADVDEYPA